MTYRYEVVLANTFEANSPEEATRAMIHWLQDADLWDVYYRVQREHQDAIDHVSGRDAATALPDYTGGRDVGVCRFCGMAVRWTEQGAWVDNTEGDVCSGDDDLNNENEHHVPSWPAYTIKPNAVKHTCWNAPDWDGLMQDDCAGCQEAAQYPCHWCGYGDAFTTHNDVAHAENGDPYVPEHPANEWHDSPHIYKEAHAK